MGVYACNTFQNIIWDKYNKWAWLKHVNLIMMMDVQMCLPILNDVFIEEENWLSRMRENKNGKFYFQLCYAELITTNEGYHHMPNQTFS